MRVAVLQCVSIVVWPSGIVAGVVRVASRPRVGYCAPAASSTASSVVSYKHDLFIVGIEVDVVV